ncbi:MAG TPA: glycine cleavage system protein GcvH [Gemmatimonadota bacterium]|nr:glycine cleavage system protein GcvH [Gemmatimonadota bacterium]
MANVPEDLRYSKDHEWVAFDEQTGVATVGITDYAQGELGDVVFVELPSDGADVTAHAACGTIEAVKAVAELFAPVSGSVAAVNAALEDSPETVNADPYGAGWMLRIQLADRAELDDLMDAAGYLEHIG